MIARPPSSPLFPYTTLFRSDSELADVKGFLVGSFPLTIETPSQIASQVASVKLLGLGDEYLRLYRDRDRKSTRLNSSHTVISYAVFCLKKKNKETTNESTGT